MFFPTFCSNIDVEGVSEARESVENEDANHCEGDCVLPTYPEERLPNANKTGAYIKGCVQFA